MPVHDVSHRCLVGCRRGIGREGEHLLATGRKAGEDERQTPHERLRGSGRRRLEADRVEAGGHEAIDRVVAPIGTGWLRRSVFAQRLIAPPRAALGEIDRGLDWTGRGGLARVGGPGGNPGGEGSERVVVETLSPLGHLETWKLVPENGEEAATLRGAGNEDRTPCPADAHPFAMVEDEPPFRSAVSAVAFLALFHEHRPDPRLEEC